MSYRTPHPGPQTAMRGAEVLMFGFRINGSDDPDFLWQARANAIDSVVRAGAGTFTVQMKSPYPRALLGVIPKLAQATANTTIEDVRYVVDSYDEDAGTFTLETITDDGDGTLTVEDPTDNVTISVWLVFQTTEVFAESQA